MADAFKRGPSTHKTLRCGSCGAITIVRKEMVGKTLCDGSRRSPGCRSVLCIAASEEK